MAMLDDSVIIAGTVPGADILQQFMYPRACKLVMEYLSVHGEDLFSKCSPACKVWIPAKSGRPVVLRHRGKVMPDFRTPSYDKMYHLAVHGHQALDLADDTEDLLVPDDTDDLGIPPSPPPVVLSVFRYLQHLVLNHVCLASTGRSIDMCMLQTLKLHHVKSLYSISDLIGYGGENSLRDLTVANCADLERVRFGPNLRQASVDTCVSLSSVLADQAVSLIDATFQCTWRLQALDLSACTALRLLNLGDVCDPRTLRVPTGVRRLEVSEASLRALVAYNDQPWTLDYLRIHNLWSQWDHSEKLTSLPRAWRIGRFDLSVWYQVWGVHGRTLALLRKERTSISELFRQ
jgi:hypothetical protein